MLPLGHWMKMIEGSNQWRYYCPIWICEKEKKGSLEKRLVIKEGA